MNGASHPIESSPIEILHEIFKWVIKADERHYKSAIILSHVCKSWRTIALSISSLWVNIILHHKQPLSVINPYWDEMMLRTRGVPLKISIYPSAGPLRNSLPTNFTQAKAIDTLCFFLGYPGQQHPRRPLRELFACELPTPGCPVRYFRIRIGRRMPSGPPKPLDLEKWLSCWPPFTDIEIPGYFHTELNVNSKISFPSVKILSILTGAPVRRPVDFFGILKRFPKLEELSLGLTHSRTHFRGNTPILMPFLRSLKVGVEKEFLWSGFLCPKLRTLKITTRTPNPSLYGFVGSHSSLQSLGLQWCDAERLRQLSAAAPQITMLTVGNDFQEMRSMEVLYNREQNGGSTVFPNLEHIVLDHYGVWMGNETFESLVTTRFLPLEHPDSRLLPGVEHPINCFTVTNKNIYPDKPLEEPEWNCSHLFDLAKSVRITRDRWGISYEMRWVD